jgi:hypothetical protein
VDSDCNERVLRVFFERTFKPNVTINIRNQPSRFLDQPVYIREINGRKDWCVDGSTDCGTQIMAFANTTMNPVSDSIVWMVRLA